MSTLRFPVHISLSRRTLYLIVTAFLLSLSTLLLWPHLLRELLTTNFLPHFFCYRGEPRLIWTHTIADALIGTAYFAISVTLVYLINKAQQDIPFHWMFLAFGLFIIACGGTHFMEVVTIWIPVYVFSAVVKVFTAVASLTTAAVLPFTVPRVLTLVQQAKSTEQTTARLRASEERKEALLREVHHRVKNNLAVICSIFYLQSTHVKEQETVDIFHDMENRVHSMALVHESLYSSEDLACLDFADYARGLAEDILASYETPSMPVRLKTDLQTVNMAVDLALPCGLILNELISNAFKHGFPNGPGEIKLTLRKQADGKCCLSVEDNGVGIPFELDVNTSKSLGLRLVRLLTQQIRGSFELIRSNPGTSAHLQFAVEPYAC
ncbi:MAG TPA: sensor histidine kinase [Terriglobales bacterium]|nr:sensor histidine kinase [Terriglobales bacterium]